MKRQTRYTNSRQYSDLQGDRLLADAIHTLQSLERQSERAERELLGLDKRFEWIPRYARDRFGLDLSRVSKSIEVAADAATEVRADIEDVLETLKAEQV